MNSSPSAKTYQYTFYGHYNHTTPQKTTSYSSPLGEQDKNQQSGHFTTMHTNSYASSNISTPTKIYREPIFQ